MGVQRLIVTVMLLSSLKGSLMTILAGDALANISPFDESPHQHDAEIQHDLDTLLQSRYSPEYLWMATDGEDPIYDPSKITIKRNPQSYIRLGRDRSNSFMRLGKSDKGFIRFGRSGVGERGFVRLGRSNTNDDELLNANDVPPPPAGDDAMRFGRRGDKFIRFGRSQLKGGSQFSEFVNEKMPRADSFIRFGRDRNDNGFIRLGKKGSTGKLNARFHEDDSDGDATDGFIQSEMSLTKSHDQSAPQPQKPFRSLEEPLQTSAYGNALAGKYLLED